MGVIRSRRLLERPSLVVCTVLVLVAVVPAALAAGPLGPPPAQGQACPTAGLLREGRLPAVRESSLATRLSTETLLTERGEESGRRLAVGSGTRDTARITLPPESFVAGPYGGVVLYGSHDPLIGSEVRAVEMATGCDERLARPAGIVRSAVLDGRGAAIYVHAVTDAGRQDAGVVRHDLATGGSTQVVDPLPPSEEYGPTFATMLAWRTDGAELAVQSCGFSRCRTRVLDLASGVVRTYDAEPHGQLLGFDAQSLYAFNACHWAPCDVLAIERASGASRVLVEDAYEARLASGPGGPKLEFETSAGRAELAP